MISYYKTDGTAARHWTARIVCTVTESLQIVYVNAVLVCVITAMLLNDAMVDECVYNMVLCHMLSGICTVDIEWLRAKRRPCMTRLPEA